MPTVAPLYSVAYKMIRDQGCLFYSILAGLDYPALFCTYGIHCNNSALPVEYDWLLRGCCLGWAGAGAVGAWRDHARLDNASKEKAVGLSLASSCPSQKKSSCRKSDVYVGGMFHLMPESSR